MRGLVKLLGDDDEALLELGRKPYQARAEPLQRRDAVRGLVKLLGDDDEALLERGRKPRPPADQPPEPTDAA